MSEAKYLIGKATTAHPDNGLPARLTVVYFPRVTAAREPDVPHILVELWQDGTSDGTTRTAREMLEHRPYIPHRQSVEGVTKTTFEQEPPGWFERKCAQANCLWFVPFVKRMAAGEEVTLRDIQTAYRSHNQSEMPSGTLGTPFP